VNSLSEQNTCQLVGRLLVIDVGSGYRTVADVEHMMSMIAEQSSRVPKGTRLVTAADWRACRIFTPEVAAKVKEMLAQVNPRLERGAILQNMQMSTSVLQVLRLTREAHHPDRRVFTDAAAMVSWLSEVLTPSEASRARVRLVGGD
jgi:hypothetical protein